MRKGKLREDSNLGLKMRVVCHRLSILTIITDGLDPGVADREDSQCVIKSTSTVSSILENGPR